MKNTEIDKLLDKALKERNSGNIEESLQIMLRIYSDSTNYDKEHVLYGLIGSTYFLLNKYDLAIKFYDMCLEIRPSAEGASSGKFHSHFSLGDIESALKELKRFLEEYLPRKEYYYLILEDLSRQNLNLPEFQGYKDFIIKKYKELIG